jgi:hypothetical protein
VKSRDAEPVLCDQTRAAYGPAESRLPPACEVKIATAGPGAAQVPTGLARRFMVWDRITDGLPHEIAALRLDRRETPLPDLWRAGPAGPCSARLCRVLLRWVLPSVHPEAGGKEVTMAHHPPGRFPLTDDEARVLRTMATRPSMRPASPRDAEQLARLVDAGYVARDPAMQAPTYRLTIRGWVFVRTASAGTE